MAEATAELGVEVLSDAQAYERDLSGVDAVVSFLYPARIREPLISAPTRGCINFHPAPLPAYRGFAVYNFGILNGEDTWGVTAHYVDGTFDTGDLIETLSFPIDPDTETPESLRRISQAKLLELFDDIMGRLAQGVPLPRAPQGEGTTYHRRLIDQHRFIAPQDSAEVVHRKIRAFWCPPYDGAAVEIDGEEFTLVNREVLRQLAAAARPDTAG
jgi:methionyl-tRNA formyltransferase